MQRHKWMNFIYFMCKHVDLVILKCLNNINILSKNYGMEAAFLAFRKKVKLFASH